MIPLSADETSPLSGASTKSMPSTAPARQSATLATATRLPSLSVTAPAETSAKLTAIFSPSGVQLDIVM